MATHSSVLAWRIPGTGEPGGLPSTGSHRVGHDWSDLAAAAPHSRYCNPQGTQRQVQGRHCSYSHAKPHPTVSTSITPTVYSEWCIGFCPINNRYYDHSLHKEAKASVTWLLLVIELLGYRAQDSEWARPTLTPCSQSLDSAASTTLILYILQSSQTNTLSSKNSNHFILVLRTTWRDSIFITILHMKHLLPSLHSK